MSLELNCLQYCIMANDSRNSLNDTKTWHLYMTFHYVILKNFLTLQLPMFPLVDTSIFSGLDYGYDDGGGQNCYDFGGLGFRCIPLT